MIPVSNTRQHHPNFHPWSIELKPWPFWDQLRDPMPTGMPNTNDDNNCGPESVAMCLRFLTGVALPADFIKDVMKGGSYAGYTDVPDLEGFLENNCQTPAVTILTSSQGNQLWWEWKFLRQGKPLIGLFWSDVGGIGVGGHFRAVIGVSPSNVITADPWTGQRRVETHHDHWAWSKGLLIAINRKRSLGT